MSSDAEQTSIILPDGGPDSQELDRERRKGNIIKLDNVIKKNLIIALCLLSNDTLNRSPIQRMKNIQFYSTAASTSHNHIHF